MAQHYDAGTKFLLKLNPQAWLSLLGLPDSDLTLMDTDLSTVTTSSDSAIFLHSPKNIRHLEFQSGYYANLIRRSLFHNRLRNRETDLMVKTTLILLHPRANSPDFTGIYIEEDEEGVNLFYRYQVVRVWEIPVEEFLKADVALLPYAPLAKLNREELPIVLETMRQRISQETDRQTQTELWTATRILMGLKFNNEEIERFLRGVTIKMRESVTYQAILEEGREEGKVLALQDIILRTGSKRFGEPTEEIQNRVLAVNSEDKLFILCDRLAMVESWTEFFAE